MHGFDSRSMGSTSAPRRWLVRAAVCLLALTIVGCTGGAGTVGGPSGANGSDQTSPDGSTGTTRTASPAGTPATGTEVEELLASFRDSPDPETRLDVVKRLNVIDDARIGPALKAALADEDLDVRCAAAAGLASRGDVHAVAKLSATLKVEVKAHPFSEFVTAASRAIGDLGGSVGVPALIQVLRNFEASGRPSEDKPAASAAQKAIGAIGSPALAALKKAVASSDADLQLAAITGLAELGPMAVNPLIGVLKDGDTKVRSRAANKLGYLGDRSAEAGLVGLLTRSEANTASIALARLYQDQPTKLTHYLTSTKTFRVYYGLVYLGFPETVNALASALHRVGDLTMAEFFLNCGNPTLEKAAEDWADDHGYSVISVPGSGDGTWGSGLPD